VLIAGPLIDPSHLKAAHPHEEINSTLTQIWSRAMLPRIQSKAEKAVLNAIAGVQAEDKLGALRNQPCQTKLSFCSVSVRRENYCVRRASTQVAITKLTLYIWLQPKCGRPWGSFPQAVSRINTFRAAQTPGPLIRGGPKDRLWASSRRAEQAAAAGNVTRQPSVPTQLRVEWNASSG